MSKEVIALDLIASVGKMKTATSTTISHHANDKGGTKTQSIISLTSSLETIVSNKAHRSNKTAPKEEDDQESESDLKDLLCSPPETVLTMLQDPQHRNFLEKI